MKERSDVVIDLALAVAIWFLGFGLFGRFIAPRWKVFGKLAFYMLVAVLLSWFFGHWSLVWIVGHPLLGVGGHIWWCRRNGINWVTCQPRGKYLQLRPWAASDSFSVKEQA